VVVTQSLARGAVREAVRAQSERHAALIMRLRASGVRAPSTRRRFQQWFREREAIHEREALLIAYGMARRRVGAFAFYSPRFLEAAAGWNAEITRCHVEFSPGRIERCEWGALPAEISGHALERMFQRTDTIEWSVIRDCLADATLQILALAPAWIASGARQCAVLAERGMLVGQVADRKLALRTFLPGDGLAPRWASLHADLEAFAETNAQPIKQAALGAGEEAHAKILEFLADSKRRWLHHPYVPCEDPLEDAWSTRPCTE